MVLTSFLANVYHDIVKSQEMILAIWLYRGIHCSTICLCFALSCRIRTWQSLVSVDVTVSVDPAESIAAFESEKITALSNLFRCRTVIVVQCVWRAQLIQGYS